MGIAARAFDEIASTYDASFGANLVARHLRRRVWRRLFERVRPGGRVLDLGCGTGIDAGELVRRGLAVVAVDGSPAMAERARAKASTGAVLQVLVADLGDTAARRAALRGRRFDAVLSNFGALNCIADLPALADDVAEILPPGGTVLAVVMSRFCLWEIAYHLLKGAPRPALRRLRRGPVSVAVGGGTIPVRYYGARAFARCWSRRFRLVHAEALGVVLPPPYLARRFAPEAIDRLARLDEALGPRWPWRSAGDHVLVVLERDP